MVIKFGERLKELRLEAGLKQNELGKAVGLSGTAIGHWERNERIPNIEAVILLARYFNVSLDYMAGLVD